jgi:two-component system chemotaxis sensor kinase CheA
VSADRQDGNSVELELRDRIEELAKQWVLGDTPGDAGVSGGWAAQFNGIRDCARKSGDEALAELAGELAAEAETGAGSEESCRRLEEGLRQLQAAMPEAAEPAPASNSLSQDPELVGDFVTETRDHLSNIETQLLLLEKEPSSAEPVHAIFRAFHTIKGLAGFLEFESVREVAHEIETVLDNVRNATLDVTPALIDAILAGADFLAGETGAIERGLAGGGAPQLSRRPDHLLAQIRCVAEHPGAAADRAESLAKLSEAVAGAAAPAPETLAAIQPEQPALPDPPGTPNQGEPKQAAAQSGRSGPAQAESAIKVDTARLDYLVDMIGELVITQSLVRHNPDIEALHNGRLSSDLGQLARITQEVQKTAMSMRMVPVGQLFRRMARLVRDLCRKAGKQAELETYGDDTELDRNMVEELADPMMHMVRNAVDHGIESESERAAAGKDPVARIQLRASHQAGHILIEICDDGRGIDREKVIRKARERGLVQDAAHLSDSEAFNLIFEPGFSTAEQVTDISGRGVGMDVVKKHVQKLRGHVDVESTLGRGTRFVLKVPLTLAIIDGLVVGVGQERYILPIFAVKEMIRPEPGMISTVENRLEVALIRGRTFPVLRLGERFCAAAERCDGVLVIAEARGRDFALMVDTVLGKQEVVIKSLGESLKDIPGIAGGAILGNGRVGLILDVDSVFWRAAA